MALDMGSRMPVAKAGRNVARYVRSRDRRAVMANDEHLALLRQGSVFWNEWRHRRPDIKPDLSKADLSKAQLRGADLRGTDLSEADLRQADLREVRLSLANLRGADIRGANLDRASCRGADLGGTNLCGATLSWVNFHRGQNPRRVPRLGELQQS
jgi:uncharacterized protein YjbI with pentapeptide repeats